MSIGIHIRPGKIIVSDRDFTRARYNLEFRIAVCKGRGNLFVLVSEWVTFVLCYEPTLSASVSAIILRTFQVTGVYPLKFPLLPAGLLWFL